MVQQVKEEIVSYYLQLLPCQPLFPLHSVYPTNSSEFSRVSLECAQEQCYVV